MPHCWKSHVSTHLTLTACDGLTEIRELKGLPEPVNAATPNPALEKVNYIFKRVSFRSKNGNPRTKARVCIFSGPDWLFYAI